MDGRSELQLLPGTKKRLGIKVPGENKFLYIGSAILGATFVTIFAFGRYQASLEAQVKQVEDQLVTLEKERDKEKEQNLKLFKDRIELTKTLLDGHIYWTQAISIIVNLLQNNVRFTSFSSDIVSKTIGIEVEAASYTALARQVASLLTEESISDISLGKILPLPSGLLESNFTITFDQAKLFQKINK